MSKGLVSVIIPTFRRDSVLARALDSLAIQTYDHFEIVVVDDNAERGWNERVAWIVDAFANKHPGRKVHFIQNERNLGSAETRNIGIQACNGEYICFLDDDDVYLPNRIEHQLDAMVRAGADFSITDLKIYNEHEKLVDSRIRTYLRDDGGDLLRMHLMHHITGTDTIMFKREYLVRIGGFDSINVGDEFYLMTKAIQQGGRFLYVPGCMVKAYVHSGGGLSSGQGKIDGENRLYAFKQGYFDKLDKGTVRYIKTRHHAVLAYAYLRSRSYGRFLWEGAKAVLCQPVSALKIITGRGR